MSRLFWTGVALAFACVGGACGKPPASATGGGGGLVDIARALTGPYLGPEFPLDNPTSGPELSDWTTAAAFDGTNFFVVWVDKRQPNAHIYGTRVSAAGVVLDPQGIPIGTATVTEAAPAIGYGGGQFLVAWQQTQAVSSTAKIYVSRVGTDGKVLDPAGVAVSTNTGNDELTPAIGYDGTNFLVVWGVGMSSGGRIAGARISAAGKLLDTPSSITVTSSSSSFSQAQGDPAIIFDGTNYLVAWQDDRASSWDIYATRVTPAGAVLDGTGFVVANTDDGENAPKMAFDGTNTLVTWSDWPSGGSRESSIYGRRVSPAGTIVDTTALALSTATGEQSGQTVSFDGTGYLVAWADYRVGTTPDIYGTRVTTDGTVLDPTGKPLATGPAEQFAPNLIAGGGQTLFTWSDSTVRGARLDTAAASKDGAGFPLTAAPNTEVDPDAAFDGTNYLVVWTDSRLGSPAIYGNRVSRQGAVLEVDAFQISSGTATQSTPSVAWNGTSYLVAWAGTASGVRRVTPGGTVLDAADIALPGFVAADVASDGTDFLVVGAPAGANDISALRVSAAGSVLDAAPIPITTNSASQYYPRVTFDGTSYVTVWVDYRSSSHPFGVRVTSAGTVLDPDGVQLTVPTGSEYQNHPDITSDGAGTSFAVWEDSRGYAIRGTRISAGTVLDPAGAMVVLAPSANDMLSLPGIAFDGTNYLVGAVDHKYDTSFTSISYNLAANRISPAVAALGALPVATHPTASLPAALASDRMGGTLFTYVFPDTASGFPVSRVRARVSSRTPPATRAPRPPAARPDSASTGSAATPPAAAAPPPTASPAASRPARRPTAPAARSAPDARATTATRAP